ncbi:hypothetical protein ACFVS2_21390 [Brevibacillus sp. NPDC058079]|uniref:hypothetical protein n=1 Tax=Brevibacillus sp. NPDC058079 TaxID=3346330 RepID=UPI0036F0AEAF
MKSKILQIHKEYVVLIKPKWKFWLSIIATLSFMDGMGIYAYNNPSSLLRGDVFFLSVILFTNPFLVFGLYRQAVMEGIMSFHSRKINKLESIISTSTKEYTLSELYQAIPIHERHKFVESIYHSNLYGTISEEMKS